MDRAEILSLTESSKTQKRIFTNVMKIVEGTTLNPLEWEIKTHAPRIGLIQDANLLFTEYGFAAPP